MNTIIWDSLKPTIEGIFSKIQNNLEQYSEKTKDRQRFIIYNYAKLIQEMLKYTES